MKKTQQAQSHSSFEGGHIDDYGYDRSMSALGRSPHQVRRHKRRQHRTLSAIAVIAVLAALLFLIGPRLAALFSSSPSSGSSVPAGSTAPGTATDTASGSSGTTTFLSAITTAGGETSQSTSAESTLSPAERQSRITAAGAEATQLLQGHTEGRFSIFYQSLTGGETWAYQEEEPFVAASSIKLGINTYLYTKIASGEISPDEILAYDNRAYPTGDYEGGTGTIQSMANGTKMTVRETSGLSIRISDNCGTNMVIRRLGGIDAINPWLSQISGKVDYRKEVSYTNYAGQAKNGRHRTCALDLGLQAVNLYRLWQADPDHYQPLVDDLCQTEFDFGIQKGIPADIRVAHKIGTNGTYSAENDVGIVFTSEPFVLCVMTEMASAAKAHEIQADIARIFYECQTGLTPRVE
ncbi:MAG: serine hydrolase [Clostridiaceae bacterium]|nr:serine hydrolase [Clostridiaceae bacterium]